MGKRIAVVHEQKCKPYDCGELCMRVCPVNKTGGECIWLNERTKAAIDEILCIGCGICVKKCPYGAIDIINLPEELDFPPIHRYGRNGFHLYNLPIPMFGKVVGIVGKNGIGKSTALKILSGLLKPNLGTEETVDYDAIIDYFKGTEAQAYFEKVRDGGIKVAVKPQLVETIPDQFQGTVRELLQNVNTDTSRIKDLATRLDLADVLDRTVDQVSGGELQRIAIAATVLKDANVFFFDEPTSYLDIKQRLKVSKFIRELATEDKAVIIIEHDLIILDAMTDLVHLMYGKEDVYGIVSKPKATKSGINTYLSGYIRDENIRFRNYAITFGRGADRETGATKLVEWSDIHHHLGEFALHADAGTLHKHEVIGVLGENGIGKTSFVKLLAGVDKPEDGEVDENVRVSYKPQYLKASEELVASVLADALQHHKTTLVRPLELSGLLTRKLSELSGGQLQRVAVAVCLAKDADLYLLDEPSAYLDVEQRLIVSKVLSDFMLEKGKTGIVVDHDLLFIDYLSTRLMVFDGKPAQEGHAKGPFAMQEGMNRFLRDIELTFRRDEETNRPRANKPGSQMDQRQKREKKLYYT